MAEMSRKQFATAGIGAASIGMLALATRQAHASDASGSDLEMQVARLASVEEIRNQLFNYCASIDRIDYDLGYSVFAEDSECDYGVAFQGTGREFIDYCLPAHLNCKWTHHMYGAMRIDVNETNDKAASSTYGYIMILTDAATAAESNVQTDQVSGDEPGLLLMNQRVRYNDEWEQRDGIWVITKRVVSYDIGFDLSLDYVYDRENTYRGDEYMNDPFYSTLEFAK